MNQWVIFALSGLLLAAVLGLFYWLKVQYERDVMEYDTGNDTGNDTGVTPVQYPIFFPSLERHTADTVVIERDTPVTIDTSPVSLSFTPPSPVTGVSSQVMARHVTFTLGKIVGEGQTWEADLQHTIVGRKTGGGKTNILISAGAQSLARGCDVWFLSPKYIRIDSSDGLDLLPFIQRVQRVAVKADFGLEALRLLEEAVLIINKRVTDSQAGLAGFDRPLVIIVDEAKGYNALWRMLEVWDQEKKAVRRGKAAIEYILSTGRQVEVILMTAGQDVQAQSLDLSQGTQSNFLTKIGHSSLDPASLRNVLPRGVTLEQLPQAQTRHDWYVVTDDETGTPKVALVTVPRVTNQWLLRTLDRVPLQRADLEEPKDAPVPAPAVSAPKTSTDDLPGSDGEQRVKLAYFLGQGLTSKRELAKRVYNVPDGGGSYSRRIQQLIDEVGPLVGVTGVTVTGEKSETTQNVLEKAVSQPVTVTPVTVSQLPVTDTPICPFNHEPCPKCKELR